MRIANALAFAAAAALSSALVTATAQAQTTFLIGNTTVGDAQAVAIDRFAQALTKHSGGKLNGQARHGSALGGYGQMIPAMQAGSIGGLILPTGFMAGVVPEMSLFDLPFLTPGAPAKISAFTRQSEAAKRMSEAAAQRGILVLGYYGIGPQSFLTKFPLKTAEDLKGKRFRVIPSPPRLGAYQDWGAVPRPMELGEVYTSLQQGTIDGMDNPPDVIFRMKHHEAAKFYTITEHVAFVSAIVVSKRFFDGQPKEIQDAILAAAKETLAGTDALYSASQDDSLKEMSKTTTVTTLPAPELAKLKDLTMKGVWTRLEADAQRGALVKQLRQDAERYAASAK